MLGASTVEVQGDRLETARAFAERHRAYLALKGSGTVTAGPNGRIFVNPTGNPDMASGGSGDVLTGMMGAFLAAVWIRSTHWRPRASSTGGPATPPRRTSARRG